MGKVYMCIKKMKTKGAISNSYDHNMRIRFCDNADKERSSLNRELFPDTIPYTQFLKNKISDSPHYKNKAHTIRKNAVLALDICVSVNKEELEENPKFDIDIFCDKVKEWLIQNYGEKNIAGAVLHLDEHAPHIHAMVIPMTEDGRLSCYRFIRSRDDMEKMQDSIAEALEDIGIERGLRGSVATPVTMKRFYGAVEQDNIDTLPKPLQGETAEQYATRANLAFNEEKMRKHKEILEHQRREVELETELKQFLAQRDEQDKLRDKVAEMENDLKAWKSIETALQQNLIAAEEQRELIRLMSKAKKTGEAYIKENKQKKTEKTITEELK